MSLDVKVLKTLDELAESSFKDRRSDERALSYINSVPLPHSQPYVRLAYLKYYFEAKEDYKKEQEGNV